MKRNDYILWVEKLEKYEEVEIILLKGFLVLEQIINVTIQKHLKNPKAVDDLGLSMSIKINLLSAMIGNNDIIYFKYLKEINRIRNKLAHELDFNRYHYDLKKWACDVLGYRPKTINTKRTYRNSVIKAFALLVGYFVGFSGLAVRELE